MKILTNEDLPALASIIREVTHRKVVVGFQFLHLQRNHKDICIVTIDNGKVFSTNLIRGFDMHFNSSHLVDPWNWRILI